MVCERASRFALLHTRLAKREVKGGGSNRGATIVEVEPLDGQAAGNVKEGPSPGGAEVPLFWRQWMVV
jgi:hypothetical protein